MIAGCLSQGMDVEYVGVISTPGLIYLSKIRDAIGVIITASHNPYQDNGIKVIYQGKKAYTRGRREARTGNGKKKSSAIPYGQIYK